MENLVINTWNLRGANHPVKRVQCLKYIFDKGVDIACLQETHLLAKDVNRLQNKHYKMIAFSTCSSKQRGVAILARRRLNLKILSHNKDDDGRFCYVILSMNKITLCIAALYAPNVFDARFFDQVRNSLAAINTPIVLAGDFNQIFDMSLDTSHPSTNNSLKNMQFLNNFCSDLSLCDMWRINNPTVRDYTFYSGRHRTYSRIDAILVSKSLAKYVGSTEIQNILISDHAPVAYKFNFTPEMKKAKRWRFNTFLLQDEKFTKHIIREMEEFVTHNSNSDVTPHSMWEATKCFIRSVVISYSSHVNQSSLLQLKHLETDIKQTESELKIHVCDSKLRRIKALKARHKNISRKKAEFLLLKTRQAYYEYGERPSHLLALRLKQTEQLACLDTIRDASGNVVCQPEEVNKVLKNYYRQLYSNETNSDGTVIEDFLSKLDLPRLTPQQAAKLDSPLTLEELEEALCAMNKGRSPGLDGLPPELLLLLWKYIGPLLLNSINYSLEIGSFHRDQKSALIFLLLKKDKDPLDCGSYRPLSLLNSDIKLYAKCLARRLESCIHFLIHQDQTGFMKSRHASDNIRRLLHVIDQTDSLPTPSAILSMDAEKAFDRVEWKYMFAVLHRFGFGPFFIAMIQTLYNCPTACISTGTVISSQFPLKRGTRQGCPLSPLLFNITLEPLAQAVRQNTFISPIEVKGTKHHISLYADDVLLYLSDLPNSLPKALQLFELFGSFSGYKINLQKSVLLPLNIDITHPSVLQSASNISCKDEVIYLGIIITRKLSTLKKRNYDSILSKIKTDFDKWSSLQVTLHGRISVIKMNVLPRLTFLFSMLPLDLPYKFINQIDSLCSKFIWNGKRARIKLATLQRPKSAGGLALPNFQFYYWAFQLKAMNLWLHPEISVSWRSVENELSAPYRLQDLPFSGLKKKTTLLHMGSIISNTLQVWDKVCKFTNSSAPLHELSPIWRNSFLLTGSRPFVYNMWSSCNVHILNDIFNSNGMLSFQDLCVKFLLPSSSFFMYLRLRSVLHTARIDLQSSLPKHPMITMFHPSSFGKFVALAYTQLMKQSLKTLPITMVWNGELGKMGISPQWDSVWQNIFSSSKNLAHQLIHYKLVHRYYATPLRRFQMKLVGDPICRICSLGKIGTFLHVFWECPKIANFWKYVVSVLSNLLGVVVPLSPDVLLLADGSKLELNMKSEKILLAGLTAAKKTILKGWMETSNAYNAIWLGYFYDVILLEKTTARIHKAKDNTIAAWNTAAEKIIDLQITN